MTKRSYLWRTLRWAWRIHSALLLLVLLVFGYGTTLTDHARFRAFTDACPTWRVNPEFRRVQDQYIKTGASAMAAKVAMLRTSDFIMAGRSVPFLPPSLAANEGSRRHYEDFSAGELSAYLRLSAEQGTNWVIASLEDLARSGDFSEPRLRRFLQQFKTDEPFPIDEGAIASLRKLIADTDPVEPFTIRGDVPAHLAAAAAKLAKRLELPADPYQMTFQQQQQVYESLDDYVQATDPQLWRTKQVNDFLNGVWSVSFGQTYARWITPIVNAWYVARVVGPLWLIAWIALAIRAMRRANRGSPSA